MFDDIYRFAKYLCSSLNIICKILDFASEFELRMRRVIEMLRMASRDTRKCDITGVR